MKKLFALLIIFTLLVPTVMMPLVQAETTNNGMTFSATDDYRTDKIMTELPVTIEAIVKLPAGQTKRGGVIVGNYIKKDQPAINLEIHTNGRPRVYYIDNTGALRDATLSANVCTGEWVHIAAAFKASTNKLYWYINGEPVSNMGRVYSKVPLNFRDSMVLGNDNRSGSSDGLFTGEIREVLIYNDLRTADEIAADYASDAIDTDGLIAAYRPTLNQDGTKPETIPDLSGNGYDMKSASPWAKNAVTTNPYAYSMAVIGDTQTFINSSALAYNNMIEWIGNSANKTKYAFALGSFASSNTTWNYALAEAALFNLGTSVPYSVVRGYDDTTANYNLSFDTDRHGAAISGGYDDTMLNTYSKFEAGNVKYMAISLDFEASEDVLNWASALCAANPDRNVIIATHENLAFGAAANGQNFWDKLIKKHSNISLVLCRDMFSKKVSMTTKTGDSGNKIVQIVMPRLSHTNYANSGLVGMMYFSENGENVQFRYYSTLENKYLLDENQFSFTLDTVNAAEDKASQEYAVTLENSGDVNKDIDVNKEYTFVVDETGFATGKNLTFNLTLNTPLAGKMIMARYTSSGVLTSIESRDATRTMQFEIENPLSGEMVKFMLWNSFGGLSPQTNSEWIKNYIN